MIMGIFNRARIGKAVGIFAAFLLIGLASPALAQTASVSGTVFFDNNGNGAIDGLDAGIAAVTVQLITRGTDAIFHTGDDVVQASQVTGAPGTYSFGSLNAGLYRINVVAPAGHALTTANQPVYYNLTGAQVVTGQHFGYKTGAVLKIQMNTWNTIGLDSNKYLQGDGPDTFFVGARVTNIGSATASNVTASFRWTGGCTNYNNQNTACTGSPTTGQDDEYINLADIDPGAGTNYITTLPITPQSPTVSLAPGARKDFYFTIKLNRVANALNGGATIAARRMFQIDTTATGFGTLSTPFDREIYLEALQSQNRNSITSITGPDFVSVGSIVQYVVASQTSASYLEISSFVMFPPQYFEILSVAQAYSNPFSQGTTMYADACGWQNDKTQTATYQNNASCVGFVAPPNGPGTDPFWPSTCTLPNNPCSATGKTGGPVQAIYTVRVLRTPTSLPNVASDTVRVFGTIYDKSGSSFHYNSNINDCTSNCKDITITTDPTLCGKVWFDADSNAIWDLTQEPALSAVQVQVTAFDTGEQPVEATLLTPLVGDGVTTQFCGKLAGPTIIANSFRLTDGTQVITDNGAGALVGNVGAAPPACNGNAGNTVNYANGTFNVRFAVAPPAGQKLLINYTKTVQTRATDGNGLYEAIGKVGLLKVDVDEASLPANFTLTTGPVAIVNEATGLVGDGVSTTFAGRTLRAPVNTTTFSLTGGIIDNGTGGLNGPTAAPPVPLPAGARVQGNTIDYMSGYFCVTYATAPGVGVPILASYSTPQSTQVLTGVNNTKTTFDNIGYDFPDCNGNGIPDATDITKGTSLDICNAAGSAGADGIPDECQHGQWRLSQPPEPSPCGFCSDADSVLCGSPIVTTFTQSEIFGLTQNEVQKLAENFITPNNGVNSFVRRVKWYGDFGGDNQPVGKRFTVTFFNTDIVTGLPTTAVAAARTGLIVGTTTASPIIAVNTGLTEFGLDVYELTLFYTTPVTLLPNTRYWLEVFEDNSGPVIQGQNVNPGDLSKSFVWCSGEIDDHAGPQGAFPTSPGLARMGVKNGAGAYVLSNFNLAFDIFCSLTAAPCNEPIPLGSDDGTVAGAESVATLDFTNDAQGWIGGVASGNGSFEVGQYGLCMSVPGGGDNIVGWNSPEGFVQLVDGALYRVRVSATASETAADAIPLWTVDYDNYNSSGAGGTFGGSAWILDVAGGANGIGRVQGRSSFDVFVAPNAALTSQWSAGAFTPEADASNDIRLGVRVLDLASGGVAAGFDSGTICVSKLKVDRFSLDSLQVGDVAYFAPISNATHAASTYTESPLFASIDDARNVASYRLNTASDRATLIPAEAAQKAGDAWTAAALYPVEWKSDTLYMVTADIQAAAGSAGTDPLDIISIGVDTPTSELGVFHYTTSGSPGNMLRAASPRLASEAGGPQTYVGFFYGQNASLLGGSDLLRPMVDLINSPQVNGSGTGSDGLEVLGLNVTTVNLP